MFLVSKKMDLRLQFGSGEGLIKEKMGIFKLRYLAG
jgi:hypothetical protein